MALITAELTLTVCLFMTGVGVSMTRDCSTLMVAQYFKRRREFVEIFIVSGSGLGIAIMSAFIKGAIRYSNFSVSQGIVCMYVCMYIVCMYVCRCFFIYWVKKCWGCLLYTSRCV